ncbi:hypothetical protein TWF718_010615 [Orbilia javanica]|uniref:Uncharacterized protein n=1 Tax=Orbilia javanica TaxID=47235 RepID=A0AAN8MYM6_9PEZI
MSLGNGKYFILYETNGDVRQVSRGRVEDLSLGPKSIFVLHQGQKANSWTLENKSNGSVSLESALAPSGVYRDNTGPFAFPLPNLAVSLGWKLEKVNGSDNQQYIITTKDGSLAWTVSDKSGFNGDYVLLQPKDGSSKQVFTFVKDLNDYYENYFVSEASRNPEREGDRVPQSQFGYRRKGRGQRYCD